MYIPWPLRPLNVYTGQNPRQHVVLIEIQLNACNNYLPQTAEPEFLNIQWRLKSWLFNKSGLFKGQSVQQGLQWLQLFVLLLKTILCKQLRKTLKSAKMINISILYLKSLETYLETLRSDFQPNCHFKMFKNSGSGVILHSLGWFISVYKLCTCKLCWYKLCYV
jgi:hypothetical protein